MQILLTTAKDTTITRLYNTNTWLSLTNAKGETITRHQIIRIANTRTQVLLATTENAKITRWHECIWNVYTNIVDCFEQNHCGRVKHTGDHGLKGHGLRTGVKVRYNCGRFLSNTYYYYLSLDSMLSVIESSIILESTN